MQRPEPHCKIAAWASAEAKARFSALAASRGLSESKLLGLVIDRLLARNPVDASTEQQRGKAGKADHISVAAPTSIRSGAPYAVCPRSWSRSPAEERARQRSKPI